MARAHAFKKRETARLAADFFEHRKFTKCSKPENPKTSGTSTHAYIATPAGFISAASIVRATTSDGNTVLRACLGVGTVVIHERDKYVSTAGRFTMPRWARSGYTPGTSTGEPITRRAYNLTPQTFTGEGIQVSNLENLLLCVEDSYGDLYIVSSLKSDESSSSSAGSSETECNETADVPFVSNVLFSNGILQVQTAKMHFTNGRFCGWDIDEEQPDSIDLCDLQCSSSAPGSAACATAIFECPMCHNASFLSAEHTQPEWGEIYFENALVCPSCHQTIQSGTGGAAPMVANYMITAECNSCHKINAVNTLSGPISQQICQNCGATGTMTGGKDACGNNV